MILVIRIRGMVDVPGIKKETLFRMGLRRKYSAILLRPSSENLKLLRTVRDYIAYGDVSKETLKRLITMRAQKIKKDSEFDPGKIVELLEKKDLKDLNLKPFFRLHPPRGGIESKKHFGAGKGVLGDNKEKINDLVARML